MDGWMDGREGKGKEKEGREERRKEGIEHYFTFKPFSF
jgi:hypothetical protein